MSILSSRTKPFVFVLMPFDKSFDDVYQIGIKEVCDTVGAYCERVDEQVYEGRILDRIYNQITKADIVVADMTDRNPNVFYEVGFAHGVSKRRVILLTKRSSDIPFDLKDFPHIVYEESLVGLRDELGKRLRWCIDNPAGDLVSIDTELILSIQGHILEPGHKLTLPNQPSIVKHFGKFVDGVSVSLDLNNPLPVTHSGDFAIAIEAEGSLEEITGFYRAATIPHARNRKIHIIKNGYGPLYPGSWTQFTFLFRETDASPAAGKTYDFKVRLFTDVGSKSWEFALATAAKSLPEE